ncbi:unnamed protein product, partial [Rangifer tarandus platyrhynchus]
RAAGPETLNGPIPLPLVRHSQFRQCRRAVILQPWADRTPGRQDLGHHRTEHGWADENAATSLGEASHGRAWGLFNGAQLCAKRTLPALSGPSPCSGLQGGQPRLHLTRSNGTAAAPPAKLIC